MAGIGVTCAIYCLLGVEGQGVEGPKGMKLGPETERWARVGLITALTASALISSPARAAANFTAAPPPPPGEALIYIYRAPNFFNALGTAEIDIDGVKVAALGNRAYTWLYVPAHAHTMKLKWTMLSLHQPTLAELLGHDDSPVFVWNDGQTYFYRYEERGEMYGRYMTKYTVRDTVPAPDALAELAIYHYAPAQNLDKFTQPKAAAPDTAPPASSAQSTPSAAEAATTTAP